MNMDTSYVFVYGTLMHDMVNFGLIAPYVEEISNGEINGELYHLIEGFPALVTNETSGIIKGELMKINHIPVAIKALDKLEGFHKSGHPKNLYERVTCQVKTIQGEFIEAFVYIWARPEILPNIGIKVDCGDWRQFLDDLGWK